VGGGGGGCGSALSSPPPPPPPPPFARAARAVSLGRATVGQAAAQGPPRATAATDGGGCAGTKATRGVRANSAARAASAGGRDGEVVEASPSFSSSSSCNGHSRISRRASPSSGGRRTRFRWSRSPSGARPARRLICCFVFLKRRERGGWVVARLRERVTECEAASLPFSPPSLSPFAPSHSPGSMPGGAQRPRPPPAPAQRRARPGPGRFGRGEGPAAAAAADAAARRPSSPRPPAPPPRPLEWAWPMGCGVSRVRPHGEREGVCACEGERAEKSVLRFSLSIHPPSLSIHPRSLSIHPPVPLTLPPHSGRHHQAAPRPTRAPGPARPPPPSPA
jgi:hypothetical protein